jgi:hypothetical protein
LQIYTIIGRLPEVEIARQRIRVYIGIEKVV